MYDEDYDETTARYYDAAYAALPEVGRDVEFYRSLARGTGGPVLEIGCGTGRVLCRLAADGLDCIGLDASQAMLAPLRARLPDRVRLVRADMRDFDLGDARFALIYSAFRPFQHLVTVEDQLGCLARVRAHLAAGGRFAFDVFKPSLERLVAEREPEAEDVRFEQDGEQVVRYARVERDNVAQTLRVCFRYERSRDGRVLGNDHAAFTMRWFHRFELLHLLARAGFEDVQIFGDFDRSPVGPDSPAYVVLAR
jgi:SAM-dependent methyltransferase